MRTDRPPRNYDVPTRLFNVSGYKPARAWSDEGKLARAGYKHDEVIARLVPLGLELGSGLIQAAHITRDPEIVDYARHRVFAATMGATWHGIAEGTEEVTRRVLGYPSLDAFDPDDMPDLDQMLVQGRIGLNRAAELADDVAEEVHKKKTWKFDRDILEKKELKLGRAAGTAALWIAAAPAGSILSRRSLLPRRLGVQVAVRELCLELHQGMLDYSEKLQCVPSLAGTADANSPIETDLMRTMPDELQIAFRGIKASQPVV